MDLLSSPTEHVQNYTFSLDEKVSASKRTEEQSEQADSDHFCNQFDLLAQSVSVLCSVLFRFSFKLQLFVLEIKI